MIELPTVLIGSWLLVVVLGSVFNACLYSVVRGLIKPLQPTVRSLIRLAYATSGPLAAIFAVLLIAQPGIAEILIPWHCHGNQCSAHTPIYSSDSLFLVGVMALSLLVGVLFLCFILFVLHRTRRRLWLLLRISKHSDKGYREFHSDSMLALCIGLWKPKVFLSSNLINSLDSNELEIVLRHEHAHAHRFDNLRALLLRWLTPFWLPAQRERLLADNSADAEQACDAAAVQHGYGRDEVATVIEKVSALNFAASNGSVAIPSAQSTAFHFEDPAGRINALRTSVPPMAPVVGRNVLLLVLHWCIQIFLLSAVAHSLIELIG